MRRIWLLICAIMERQLRDHKPWGAKKSPGAQGLLPPPQRAWRVPVEQILANDCNLDVKNPNGKKDFEHLPPEQLVEDILKKEQRIAEIMMEIKQALGRKSNE